MKKSQLSPAMLTLIIIVGAPLLCIAILIAAVAGLLLIAAGASLWMPWGAMIAAVILVYLMLYTFVKLSMR